MLDGTWPFVGRQRDVTRIVQEWTSGGRGVFIEGLPGMGKTRLADEVAQRIGAPARIRIVGNPGSRTRPYAAIAHLLGDATEGDVAQQFLARLPADRSVIVVDEAPSLDEATIGVLNQVLSADRAMVIASGRIAAAAPPALDALISGHRFALVEVGPLDRAEVGEALTDVLGGSRPDDVSLDRLMALSAGNPLFVRELVSTALGQGAVRRLPAGTHLEFHTPSNLRLLEVVGERIADLDPAAASLLRLVAVAESLGVDDLDQLDAVDIAADLESRGLLRVDLDDRSAPGGAVRVGHPLHQEVLIATMGKLERRRQLRRALEVLDRRSRRSIDDDLRVAVWQLEVGDQPDLDVLVAGARRARAAMDLPSTLRLARAADAVRPNVVTQTLIMEAHFLHGDFEDAEQVAARPLVGDYSPTDLFTNTAIRMDNLVWGFGAVDRARAVAAERRAQFREVGMEPLLDGLEAYVSAIGGQVRVAEELLATPIDSGLAALLTAPARATTFDRVGRLQEAVDVADTALRILARLPEPKAVMDPASFQMSRGLTLLALGRFDEAERDVLAAYRSVVIDRVPFLRAFLPMALGRLALARGRTDDALAWFEESRAVADEYGIRAAERVAVAGLAATAGQRDDRTTCQHLLGVLDGGDDRLGLMRVETAIGRSWALATVGRVQDARASLRAAVEARIGEEPSPCLWALVELTRLGDAAWAADRLGLVDDVDGPFAAARRDWVRAIATGNDADLLDAVLRLDALGAAPLVAEGAAVLAAIRTRDGDTRGAGAAQAITHRALLACQQLRTPLLAAGSNVPLSPRERDVALLAADGLSSRDIADRLHLSVRTVDNHLSRAYLKLGISGRSQLNAALARHPDGG